MLIRTSACTWTLIWPTSMLCLSHHLHRSVCGVTLTLLQFVLTFARYYTFANAIDYSNSLLESKFPISQLINALPVCCCRHSMWRRHLGLFSQHGCPWELQTSVGANWVYTVGASVRCSLSASTRRRSADTGRFICKASAETRQLVANSSPSRRRRRERMTLSLSHCRRSANSPEYTHCCLLSVKPWLHLPISLSEVLMGVFIPIKVTWPKATLEGYLAAASSCS